MKDKATKDKGKPRTLTEPTQDLTITIPTISFKKLNTIADDRGLSSRDAAEKLLTESIEPEYLEVQKKLETLKKELEKEVKAEYDALYKAELAELERLRKLEKKLKKEQESKEASVKDSEVEE